MAITYNPNLQAQSTQAFISSNSDPVNYDIAAYLARWQDMPIALLRQWAALVGLGVYSRFYGERYERNFASNTYFYFINRDRKAAVDQLTRDLNVNYVADFTITSGERTGISLCLSSLYDSNFDATQLTQELERQIRWLLPHFADNITITICASVDLDLYYNVGGYSYAQGALIAEE